MLPLSISGLDEAGLPPADVLAALRAPCWLRDLAVAGAEIADVVELDEFSFDVVVRVTADLYAVYDST